MLHPQGVYPQGLNPYYPQGLNPQGLNPQGLYPQGGAGHFENTPGYFANTLYGLPQPGFIQGASPLANWQHPAQQAVQQLLAHQLAAQLGTPSAGGAMSGLSNGTGAQATGAWPQHNNPAQISPTIQQQWTQQQPSFQQLAQHHYAIAQQFLQLAAQQTFQGTANPYAGQFIPATMGGGFVPGITMH
jgi:hypothetical protein